MILEKLLLVPHKPGCYQMKNKDGVIIYVGKAKDLRNRLNSYFHQSHTGKTQKLVSEIADFEYIVVGSESESLILEINLIKKYDPKYNILLRDDKSYPYIELTNERVPRLTIVRDLNRKRNKNYLYGPYPNVKAARDTVNLLNRLYPLRKCRTYSKKPCLYYHIGQCLGYCTNNVNAELINSMKNDIIKFLKGDDSVVTKKLKDEMKREADNLNFEAALELKELINNIEVTLTHQKVEINDYVDRDIFGYYVDRGYLSIQVFFIRGGKIKERHSKIMPLIDEIDEQLIDYIAKFYNNFLIPKEVLVPQIINVSLLEEYLNTSVKIPVKGVKKQLLDMACDNSKIALDNEFELIKRDEFRTIEANEELKNILNMDKLDKIEIFDNAHLFGTFNVSGMVVYENGKPNKNEYRKFKITNDVNDDYGTMREVIYRRYFRVLKDDLVRPDLIIVDGGIGQINAAKEIIDSLHMNIKIVGLKKDDRHTTESLIDTDLREIKIDKTSNVFYLLERMQEEVHNFTINYHKQIRSKGALASVLDSISGIGEVRKKELLKKYKNVKTLKEVSIQELNEILPIKVAEELHTFLENYEI